MPRHLSSVFLGMAYAAQLTCTFARYFYDYNILSLQRGYVESKFVNNVYDALQEAEKHTGFNLGSCPEIAVLGCGPAPEMVAVQVQFTVTCAELRSLPL